MTHTMTNSADAMMITLENVNKWYGQFHVLKDINLQVKPRNICPLRAFRIG
jgi:general L-amino acid transport system ATP-binding protein